MPAAVRRSISLHHWQTNGDLPRCWRETEALEPFPSGPHRVAYSRHRAIVLSLIEDIESKVDRAQAEEISQQAEKRRRLV